MITARPTLTELTECYELWESSDACLNCIWQEACKARRIRMKEEQGFEFLALCLDCQEVARGNCAVCGLPHCGSVFCHEDCELSDMLNKGENRMVNVSGNLMDNPKVAEALQPPKSIYPLCYCKVCKGDTKHKDCPNQDNPHRPPDSIWFRALRGEPIIAVGRG